MNRRLVPGIPFLFSLILSAFTVGTHPYWQDSGLFLTAVKELGVLYPPGFTLYLVVCHVWTRLLFFLDFTLAVHLFSSVCAALASATLAVAVRDLLRSQGKVFRVLEADPGPLAEGCGILVGVLVASGFTFWSGAVYAKGYSFYHLILALLLWRMIRADESGRPREFTIVAALIGLAWQAHPSAALAGLALLLYVGCHARTLGAKGIATRVAVAAGFALGPTLILLPILAARDPWLVMGSPQTPGSLLAYVFGIRFLGMEGVFGFDARRAASFGLYLWEEMLGVGLLLTTVGLATLVSRNSRLLVGILCWTVPYAAVTVLFKLEGQHDYWFVAAWMPLYFALGVGACRIAQWAGARGRIALAGLGLLGVGWAIAANASDLSQRKYDLAELYGRTILSPVDPGSVLLLSGDDANALVSYLQRVRGDRTDVTLVTRSFLSSAAVGDPWYLEKLLRREPFLRAPDFGTLGRKFPHASVDDVTSAAFLNENAGCGRPLFTDRFVPGELVRPDYTLAPAGVLWKLVPANRLPPLDPKYWKFPIEPEELRTKYRRERGQSVETTASGVEVKPMAYERRLVVMLLSARLRLAMALVERNQFPAAARVCESIRAADEEFGSRSQVAHILGISYHAAGEGARAEPLLRASAETNPKPEWRATARFYLGEIARRRGDEAAAQEHFRAALATPGLDEAYRKEMESRLNKP